MDTNFNNPEDINLDHIAIIIKESYKARSEFSDQMLNLKIIQKHMDTFKNGKKDSKAWTEAADFLETYFDENNRVVIDI